MSGAFPYSDRGAAPIRLGTVPGSPPILETGHRSAIAHRPDIEGLRGIAVLSVLAVHSFPALLRGGFIGVDIFFVLSGYLISCILFRSVDKGTFSILDFYARRVRRIYPALCLVLVSSLAFSLWFTFPSASRHLGHHVAAGALFLSNIALWNEAGYFDVASEAKPLLHLWSLGIEEQFYIVWPLAVVVLAKYRRRALMWIVLGLTLSFALNIMLVADKPKATFFLPPTRFWELMVGALLAYLTLYRAGPVAWLRQRLPEGSWAQRHAADTLAWSGLAMLAAALALIDKTDHFPGWWAVLPTLGTFSLIAAGTDASANRRVLCQPILRFYGAISYPLYLWHWPLLCFPVVLGIPLNSELRVMILVASVVLATLTYQFVEKPVRAWEIGPRLPLAMATLLIAIGGFGWMIKQTDGLLESYPEAIRSIASAEFRQEFPNYRAGECFLLLDEGPEQFSANCVDRRHPEKPLTLLWGDSHAASLYPGLSKLPLDDEIGYRMAQYTAALCPPLLTAPASSSKHCQRTIAAVLEIIASERPNTVVIAGHWSKYGDDPLARDALVVNLRETVRHLMALGVVNVIVFGHLPTWTIAQPRVVIKIWNREKEIPERTLDHLNPAASFFDKLVQQTVAGSGVTFVSPMALLCNPAGCLVSIRRGNEFRSVTYDDSHLSIEGSESLIERSRLSLFPDARSTSNALTTSPH